MPQLMNYGASPCTRSIELWSPGRRFCRQRTMLDAVKPLVAALSPGTYVVEEVLVDDKLGNNIRRVWGMAARGEDERITLLINEDQPDTIPPNANRGLRP